ncbi:nucleotide sugar dehydrogenase [Anaeromyxobacter dehalogenans 2CP-1]|uniref:Nucleotide sugar dehydrogenase n=1 Tax=Anaeromyxobacter dehalogenans (strain ATCC BAA-258 / DSM 21875 / 2CP-1) TaxID=455488 RepID=B8JHC2_ANAD2|nr:nucleotide sugar dehydrogenase [Anaeromyxobacter dehalogenans]ACL64824.1 nucleotide sugar dehydrogenase [Anaeromyxobacter dehalogenans 2CP-1]
MIETHAAEPDHATDLLSRLAARTARVAVVGLGYVGLPLALTFARRGLSALGVDVDPDKARAVGEGRSYLRTVDGAAVRDAVRDGRLEATTEFARVTACDAVVICVPTPLTREREPDLSFVERTGEAIAPHLRAGQAVVLESTSYPGTTEEVLLPILERGSGLRAGRDFFLAFSPEREDPGSGVATHAIPKIVGGYTPSCLEAALALYASAFDRVVPVSSTRVAEMTKLLENVFRSVNIALVNELKILCHRMDLDVNEVIDAASTKPFGFMPFQPGPGLGGHCIPIDPFYLTWKARQFEFQTRFIELAGEVNTEMPRYVVHRTMEALDARGRTLKGAKVLVLGIAYKKDVDDMRESPAVRIIELLQERGAEVVYHDPYVPRVPRMRQHRLDMVSVPLTDEALETADAVLVATDHGCVDYARVVERARLVVDTRNACRAVRVGRERIVKA